MVNRALVSWGVFGCFVAGGALWQLQAAPRQFVPIAVSPPIVGTFKSEVMPLTNEFCVPCHSAQKQIAGVDLSTTTETDVLQKRALWQRVLTQVHLKQMPPQGMPAPTQAQRDRLTKWLDATLNPKAATANNAIANNAAANNATSSTRSDANLVLSCGILVPSRVTLRRLNREEYNNTIRDLTGVDLRPADDFPSDDVGYGFDNIGDVLSISPLLMEKYLDASEKIAQAAISLPQHVKKRWMGADFSSDNIADKVGNNACSFYSNKEEGFEYSFPADGVYTLRVRAYEDHAGDAPSHFETRLDGIKQGEFNVAASRSAPQVYETKIVAKAGRQRIGLAFTNDFYRAELPENQRDRNAYIDWVEIEGPNDSAARALPASHRKIIFVTPTEIAANPEAAAREVVARLARRAYRRPASPQDIERLMSAYRFARSRNESFEDGIALALQAALVSPRFLFRLETDARSSDKASAKTGARDLNSWEMANRLSYFLWSSMPDEALMNLAAQDKLRDQRVLDLQVRRMMRDPKARALADNFAAQWLTLRRLSDVAPDREVNADWNDDLRRDMKQESLLFFDDVMRNDRSVLEFLDGKWTYLNANLARHYDIEGNFSQSFQRVVFDAKTARQRSGVLTQASVLTVTSNPTRTSPVKRGKWVMENFWGTSPPSPPPGVPELRENAAIRKTRTVRARLEEHRKNPECASCHKMMDPIGFGLENYDATGKWRERDGTLAIDTSGGLQSGEKFVGANAFKAILVKRKSQFVRALSEKMLTYALGRGLTPADDCFVRDISTATAKNNYKFSAIVLGIVGSRAFRTQGAGDVAKPNAKAAAKTVTSSTRRRDPTRPPATLPSAR